MEDRNVQSRLDAIEVQAIRLARWFKLAIYGWLLTVFVLLLSTCTRGTRAAQESNAQKDVLRVHQLVVVDEKGIDRIVIGPVPDPQMMGKRVKRRAPGTGIQLNSGTRGTTFHSLAHHLWVRHWTNNNSVDALLVHDDQLMNSKYILLRLRFLSRLGLPCPCGQQ